MYCCREPRGSKVWWCVNDDDILDIPKDRREDVELYKENGTKYFINKEGLYEEASKD